MVRKPGAYFEKELLPFIRAVSSIAWKIPDVRTFQRSYEKSGGEAGAILGPKVRADFYSMTKFNGNDDLLESIWWEAKSASGIGSKVSYNLKQNIYSKVHQMAWAKVCWDELKGLAKQYYVVANRTKRGNHHAFLVHPNYMWELMEEGKKSVKWVDLEEHALLRMNKGQIHYGSEENIKAFCALVYGKEITEDDIQRITGYERSWR